MAAVRMVWERRRGDTTSSGSQRAVEGVQAMAIAAVGAQLLKADGADQARAGALRRPGRAPRPPPPACGPALRWAGSGHARGGARGRSWGRRVCVYIGV
jgi:hypothetical protein